MESHSDPDLVVFYHFIEIPELDLIEGRCSELHGIYSRQSFRAKVSVCWRHHKGIEKLCESELYVSVLLANFEILWIVGVSHFQLEFNVVIDAQSWFEKELYSVLCIELLTWCLELKRSKVHLWHEVCLDRLNVIYQEETRQEAQQAAHIVRKDIWASFHLQEIKAVLRLKFLQIVALIYDISYFLDWVKGRLFPEVLLQPLWILLLHIH